MKTRHTLFAVALACLISGCSTRSISDSGFYHTSLYVGELNEADVVGTADGPVSENDIHDALKANHEIVKLTPGERVMVIQSGASTPDESLLAELAKRINPLPFTGVPTKENRSVFGKSLRLTAARGGINKILCCWGVLESARHENGGKIVSWIPIAGQMIPDEKQQMRIRIRAILMEVESGRWTMLTPPPTEQTSLSASINRVSADQKQVERLKAKAYSDLSTLLAAP